MYTSPMSITLLHPLTHLSNNFHAAVRTVTLFESYHTFQHTLTSPMTITPLQQLMYLSNTFHTYLMLVTLSGNCHTSQSTFTSPP